MPKRNLRTGIAGLASILSVICTAAASGAAETLHIPENHPLYGNWQVYHSAATAVCGGASLPMSSEGPEQVRIEPNGEGTILVHGIAEQLTMQRVTEQRFEKSQVDGMQVLKRVDSAEWDLLAMEVSDDGLVYSAKKDVGGGTISYLLGWLKSEPDEINGYLTMAEGSCEVLRSYRAER